jgi:hypothetical protein
MQDRHHQLDEILLLRTAGPYIGSKPDAHRGFDFFAAKTIVTIIASITRYSLVA